MGLGRKNVGEDSTSHGHARAIQLLHSTWREFEEWLRYQAEQRRQLERLLVDQQIGLEERAERVQQDFERSEGHRETQKRPAAAPHRRMKGKPRSWLGRGPWLSSSRLNSSSCTSTEPTDAVELCHVDCIAGN